jgi:hypothetical protein
VILTGEWCICVDRPYHGVMDIVRYVYQQELSNEVSGRFKFSTTVLCHCCLDDRCLVADKIYVADCNKCFPEIKFLLFFVCVNVRFFVNFCIVLLCKR